MLVSFFYSCFSTCSDTTNHVCDTVFSFFFLRRGFIKILHRCFVFHLPPPPHWRISKKNWSELKEKILSNSPIFSPLFFKQLFFFWSKRLLFYSDLPFWLQKRRRRIYYYKRIVFFGPTPDPHRTTTTLLPVFQYDCCLVYLIMLVRLFCTFKLC